MPPDQCVAERFGCSLCLNFFYALSWLLLVPNALLLFSAAAIAEVYTIVVLLDGVID